VSGEETGVGMIKSDSCLVGRSKTSSGISVFLLEELGDARLRFARLKQYLDEATVLIEKSGKREHIFEVAGQLLYGIPDTLAKLGVSLDTAAMAAARFDYEEIKDAIQPEKVDQLELALKDVRVRRVQRRSFEDEAMNTRTAADMLDRIATHVEATGRIPTQDVLHLIGLLEGQSKVASAPDPEKVAGHLRSLGAHLNTMVEKGKPPSRVKLAGILRQIVAEGLDTTSAQLAAGIYQQSNSREDVMDGFKKHNPSMSQADLEKAADNWEKHKDVVKDKTAKFDEIKLRNRPHGSGVDTGDLIKALEQAAENLFSCRGENRAVQQALQDAGEGYVARFGPLAGMPDPVIAQAKKVKAAVYQMDGDSGALARDLERLARDIKSAQSHVADDARVDKTARFEEGKPADPTKNMDQGDKKEWAESKDEHGDKFKKEAVQQMISPILRSMETAYEAGMKAQDDDAEKEMAGAMRELERSMQTALVRAPNPGGPAGPPKGLMMNLAVNLWEFAYYWGGVASSGTKTAGWLDKKANDYGLTADMPDQVADQAMRSRFEEGEPADPTQDMSPEDAQAWKSNTEEHKDKFKDAAAREENILHETKNLYLYRTPKGLEIRLNGPTHAVVVGNPKDVGSAERAMDRLERYPARLRDMYKHASWKADLTEDING